MKVYETRIVPPQPASEERICVTRKCDLCGKVADRGEEWEASSYVVADTEVTVTVTAEIGTSYPGSTNKTVYDVDLCPACFTRRLIPWLKSQGADIKEREVEY